MAEVLQDLRAKSFRSPEPFNWLFQGSNWVSSVLKADVAPLVQLSLAESKDGSQVHFSQLPLRLSWTDHTPAVPF